VLFFGGDRGSQGVFESVEPSTGVIKTLNLTGAPAFRIGAAAIWTGTKMIVWGGYGVFPTGDQNFGDGALYDPVADAWTPMSPAPGVKSSYTNNSAIWTGTQMIVWGGVQASPGFSNDTAAAPAGVAYDPAKDSWTTLPTDGQPSLREGHVAVWDGTEMLVWGGAPIQLPAGNFDTSHPLSDGAAYNPANQTWRSLSSAPATGLAGANAVWTGTEMLVWGGYAAYGCGVDCTGGNYGYRYNTASDQWQYITTVNAPGPRVGDGMVWTGQSLVIWGGLTGGRFDLRDGAVWTP
jgi:N-acetylneuraminic acid mutarotase